MHLTWGGRVQRPLTCGPSGWPAGKTPWLASPTLQPPMSFHGGDTLQDVVEWNLRPGVSGGRALWPAGQHLVNYWLNQVGNCSWNFYKYVVDINTSDTSNPTHNQISVSITRARACQLNNQVSSFLASYSSYLDNGNMCSVLLLRNDGQERNGVAFSPATFGFQNNNSLWWPPRPRMDIDLGVQILSRKLLEYTFICIKPQVHIMSEPATIIILVQIPFSTNGAATPYFGPLGRVSCWVQFGRVLGLEHDPASLRSSSHTYKT
jgi:hypothetical protein